ncbi:uncharacterized protein LOC104898874 [Beta vulgaris subsp. vulgaris]|uniref:uncharacterized protein LOC104898874 n=1 Tax=Beta vulgaris subsp. vulgaris TaxID=3555 RepID=UPI00053FC7DF|nr:uncharacterized protein LOC104898874 [Beta vulgaris subsp. vulgaris]
MGLSGEEYSQAMNIEVMDALETKEEALAKMRIQKEKVPEAYNKKVVLKEFQENNKVWKMFLLEAAYKDHQLGKWSPKWQKLSSNAYLLKDIDDKVKDRAFNVKFIPSFYLRTT